MFRTINEGMYPTRGSKYSAAVDLYANETVVIGAGETKLIPLGVCIDLMSNNELFMHYDIGHFKNSHYLQLMPRSSLRAKGLISNMGVIDLDYVYPNEIKIIIHNPSQFRDRFTINKGDKIAQAILVEHKSWLMGIESDTERTNGFGSTGER